MEGVRPVVLPGKPKRDERMPESTKLHLVPHVADRATAAPGKPRSVVGRDAH